MALNFYQYTKSADKYGPIAQPQPVKASEPGLLSNMGRSAASGALSGVGGIFDFVGANGIAKQFYGWSDDARQSMSAEAQADMAKPFFSENDQGEIQLGEGLTDLDTWLLTMANVAGQFAPTAIPGAGLANTATKALKLGETGAKIATAVGMGATGGASATGQGMEQARQEWKQMPDELKLQSDLFKNTIREMKQQQPELDGEALWSAAENNVAERLAAEVQADPNVLIANFAGSAIADPIIGRALIGARLAKSGAFRSALHGFAIEGGTEAGQAAIQEYGINQALSQIDGRDPMDGVAVAALNEGVAGGTLGGAAGLLGGFANRPQEEPVRDKDADAIRDKNPDLASAFDSVAQSAADRQADLDAVITGLPAISQPVLEGELLGPDDPASPNYNPNQIGMQARIGGPTIPRIAQKDVIFAADGRTEAERNPAMEGEWLSPEQRAANVSGFIENAPIDLESEQVKQAKADMERMRNQPRQITDKNVIFAGDGRPQQAAQEYVDNLQRQANQAASVPRLPQKDIIFAGDQSGVRVKGNGEVYKSPREAVTSKQARAMKRSGTPVEAVQFGDGWGWRVKEAQPEQQAGKQLTLKGGLSASIDVEPAPKAFSSLVRMEHGEPTAIVARSADGLEIGRLTYMPNGGPIDVFVKEDFRRKGVATALYDELELRGGKIPPMSSGVAVSSDAEAFRANRLKAQPAPSIEAAPVQMKKSGDPFKSEKEMKISASYKAAAATGAELETVPVDGGFGFRVKAPVTTEKATEITSQAPVATNSDQAVVEQRERERIDDENRIGKPKLKERIESGALPVIDYDTFGDGTTTYFAKGIGGIDNKWKVKLELTKAEAKLANQARADIDLSDTPEEVADAKRRLSEALLPAAKRALNSDQAAVMQSPETDTAPQAAQEVQARPAQVALQTFEDDDGTLYRVEGVDGNYVSLTRNPDMLSEKRIKVPKSQYEKYYPTAPKLSTGTETESTQQPESIKWFGTQDKADAWVAKQADPASYRVEQSGKGRFEIYQDGKSASKAPAQRSSKAVQDFIDGKRDDVPTVEEVTAEITASLEQSEAEFWLDQIRTTQARLDEQGTVTDDRLESRLANAKREYEKAVKASQPKQAESQIPTTADIERKAAEIATLTDQQRHDWFETTKTIHNARREPEGSQARKAKMERARRDVDKLNVPALIKNELLERLDPEFRNAAPGAESQPKPSESKLDKAADNISDAKKAAALKLKKLIDSRKGQLNSGVDPEVLLAVAEVGALSIAEGAVKFAQWVRDVMSTTRAVGIRDEDVKPFLKEAYGAMYANPEKYGISDDIADQMDNPRDARRIDIDSLAGNGDTDNEFTKLGTDGREASEGVSTESVQEASRNREAERSPAQSGASDVSRDQRTGGSGLRSGRGMDNGEGESPSTKTGSSGRLNQSAGTSPAPQMFTITAETGIGQGGAKTKFKNNIAAIRILKQLEQEGRHATPEEQSALALYVGWGGIPQAFYGSNNTASNGWEKEAAELKALLTEDEYSAARRSTQDAHYTSFEIVNAMWSAVRQFGFTGGKVLEPSVGSGNFIGLMPTSERSQSQIVAAELDHITGGIAKLLYPGAKIQAPKGFQDVTLPDNHFDLAIGNPPFGSQSLYDGKRKHLSKFSIHNYFFAKSLDAVAPNGVLAMVVSNFLLDANSTTARQYLADRAELIGAIRLPNNAFSKNAGTEVTTDIIFLRKLREGESSDQSWVKTGMFIDQNGKQVPLNNYFIENPGMMLGEFGAYGSMYSPDSPALVAKDGQDTQALLSKAISRLPKSFMDKPGKPVKQDYEVSTTSAENVKVGSMFIKNGAIHIRQEDSFGDVVSEPVTFPNEKAKERVTGLVKIRDVFAELRKAQLSENVSDATLAKLRKELNKVYDDFVKANGPINADANKRLFRDDPSWPQVAALEDSFDKGITATVAKTTGEKAREPSAKKAAVFTTRTQSPYKPPVAAKNAVDALSASLSEVGRVDLALMSKLYGKPEETILSELKDLVFEASPGVYQTRDEYLSGNVRVKLAEAEKLAGEDKRFARNVEALRSVQPADIEAVDIDVKPGAPWLPESVMSKFAQAILGDEHATMRYNPFNASWSISGRGELSAEKQYGTDRIGAAKIVEAAANQKQIIVRDTVGETTVVNEQATTAANEKVEKVKSEFKRWVWDDDDRRSQLSRIYNDTYNTNVARKYDGSHLTFPGKVDTIKLRTHQANAVWRMMQSGTTLLDHVVGAGKTFTVIAGAMEMRRTGRAKKPMIVVPNHLVDQWAEDFIKLYPGANVLMTTKKDFEKANRKRLFARIATGDWDAVIVAHSSFGKVEMDPEFEAEFIKQQVQDMEVAIQNIRAIEGKKTQSIKQIEKQKERLQEKLKKLFDSQNKDDNLTFGELGVDALFLDEAHEFKNLGFATGMTRVAGLGNPTGSQKAADMFMKVRYVLEQTGGNNVVFATGTPISNTMAELYTMQRYLDYPMLQQQGIAHFDAWARMFGEVVSDWELSPSGAYKLNSRFAKFVNLPELMQRYLSFADVVNRDDVKLPTPQIKTGKPINVVVDRSPDQAYYIGEPVKNENGEEEYPEGSLIWRSEHIPKRPQKGDDNMLSIMSDARKAALDMRMIDQSYDDYSGSKTNKAAGEIMRLYKKFDADKGTQLVFIDLSTPKGAKAKEQAELRELIALADEGDEKAIAKLDNMSPDELAALDGDFSVYDDLKLKLIKKGIPESEIAFIHDAKTELQKGELFGKVKSGRVRVLLGSTAKMGAGMNVQERLVALHHLDAPWRPSDLEQREGRIIRQGNKLAFNLDGTPVKGFEIEILRYATKNTLDSRMWQTIESKARFIEQVRKGNTQDRSIEDVGGEAANAAEMKAASSGNPLILEEMDLRQKIRKLEQLQSEHNREQFSIRDNISRINKRLPELMEEAKKIEKDAAVPVPSDFTIKVGGTNFDKRAEAGESLKSLITKAKDGDTIAAYAGFRVSVHRVKLSDDIYLKIEGHASYEIKVKDPASADPGGLITRITNAISRIPEELQYTQDEIKRFQRELPKLIGQQAAFAKTEELAALKVRHSFVIDELKPKSKAPQQDAGNTSNIKFSKQNTIKAKPAKGVNSRLAKQFVNGIMQRLNGAAGIKVVVLETQAEAEALWQMSLSGDLVRGAYNRSTNTAYVIAENIKSMDELREVVAHEVIGHGGLQNVISKADYKTFIERLKQTRNNRAFAQQWAQIDNDYEGFSENEKAEEIFAYFVQNKPVTGPVKFWWNALKRWLHKALVSVGLAKAGDPDVEAMQDMLESIRAGFMLNRGGGFDPTDPDLRFSKSRTTEQADALDKLGLGEEAAETVTEQAKRRANETVDTLKSSSFWKRLNEGIFDGLAGIKQAEEAAGITDPNKQGYVSARLASGLSDILHGVFHYGAPEWRDGVVQRKADTKGLLEVFGMLGDDLNDWLAWMGANRAERLMAEGRENNLSQADIDELKAMAAGKEALFEEVRQEYNKINSAIIDLAEEAGLLSAEQRGGFDEEWYVPFFRNMEEEVDPEMSGIAAMVHGPRSRKGLAGQSAQIKELKGGRQSTKDLLENIIHRQSTMIDAAIKNKAMAEVVSNLEGTPFMQAVDSPDIAALSQTELNLLQKVKVMRNGKAEAYTVTDPALLRGLLQIHTIGNQSLFNRMARSAKRFLTAGITLSPDFIVKNFVRDAAHAWMINKDGFRFGADSVKGLRKAFAEDEAYRDLIFSGAAFQGGYVHGADPEAAAQQIRRALRSKGLGEADIQSYMDSLITKGGELLEAYRTASDKVENANRLSTYEAALAAGKSRKQAAYEAKDLMDYSLKGNFAMIGTMIDMLPFFNARLQGMSKLVRSMKGADGDRVLKVLSANLAMKGLKVAAFSLALAAMNDDDERYQELPDWDKDANWHFFFGDEHFRIPKPFELGILFGTMPERMFHYAAGSQPGSDLGKAAAHAVWNTLALNPIPQLALPVVEVMTNKSFFKGSQIEGMGDAQRQPEDRYNAYTSETAKQIGAAFGVSPKMVEHLILGYTGTLGGYVLGMADIAARQMLGIEAADTPISRYPVIKAFYQGDAPKTATKFQDEFYKALEESTEAYGSYKRAVEEGDVVRQQELKESESQALGARVQLNRIQRKLSELNKQAELVNNNQNLSGAEKRQKLDDIANRKNALYQNAYVRHKLGEW